LGIGVNLALNDWKQLWLLVVKIIWAIVLGAAAVFFILWLIERAGIVL
jgi:hypothetical protein